LSHDNLLIVNISHIEHPVISFKKKEHPVISRDWDYGKKRRHIETHFEIESDVFSIEIFAGIFIGGLRERERGGETMSTLGLIVRVKELLCMWV
jgi:hypothetical protein